MPECKSCGAEIIWMETRNGKKIPVDAETVQDLGAEIFDQSQGMVAHFATCPDANDFRKKKENNCDECCIVKKLKQQISDLKMALSQARQP